MKLDSQNMSKKFYEQKGKKKKKINSYKIFRELHISQKKSQETYES